MDKNSSFFDEDLIDLRKSLIEHPLYNSMDNLNDIKKFMEIHVFARSGNGDLYFSRNGAG